MAESILVVDDDPVYRHLLRRALGSLAYEVMEAVDGLQALELAGEKQPDLILLDLEMPGKDGFAVCRGLRNDERTKLIPIIIVTALEGLPNRLKALEGGADEVLNKPIHLAELSVRVRSLLSLRKYTRELATASEVLQALAGVVESRDVYTGQHSSRVGRAALRIGRAMGLSGVDLKTLETGAALHDIGKTGIPDAVLLKPGKLTPEEIQVIRAHPSIGADLVRPMKSMRDVIPLIRHHHERLDGSGYPDGLKGAQIPLLVRVISVADVYDALTSTRTYRAAMPPEKALAILAEEASKGWWDADVVKVWSELCLQPTGA